MKLSNRNLDRLMRENPLPVEPEKKQEMLAFARTCGGRGKETKDGIKMKYIRMHKIRTVIAAAVILSLMAVAISAGLVHYYYRTPDGSIVDESGKTVSAETLKETGDFALKMTGEAIVKDGFTIASVNWTRVNHRTTLTVWTTADSVPLTGLRALIDGIEYPLTRTSINASGYVGYTACDIPEPPYRIISENKRGMELRIDEPKSEFEIFLIPDDVLPVTAEYNRLTMTSMYYDNKLFFGLHDARLVNSNLYDYIQGATTHPMHTTVTTADGTVYSSRDAWKEGDFGLQGYGVGEGAGVDLFFEIPDIVPETAHVESSHASYSLRWVEGVTYAELPVPARGETLTGNWVIFNCDGMKLTISAITHTYERGRSTFTLYTPDKTYRTGDSMSEFSPFFYTASSVQFHASLEAGCPWGVVTKNNPADVPGVERAFIITSPELDDYAETNTTFRFGVRDLSVTYDGEWVLKYPGK